MNQCVTISLSESLKVARLTDEARAELHRVATTTQVILIAMINGVVVFGGIAYYLKRNDQGAPSTLAYVAATVAIACVALSIFLPRMQAQAVGESGQAKPGQQFQVSRILAAGILEGGAFLNIIIHFLDGNLLSLVVAAILVGFMIWQVPTKHSIENWAAGDF